MRAHSSHCLRIASRLGRRDRRAAARARAVVAGRARAVRRRSAPGQGRDLPRARPAGARRHHAGKPARLDRLIARHAPRSWSSSATSCMPRRRARRRCWRPSAPGARSMPRCDCTLVRGNHDSRAGDPPRVAGHRRRRRAASDRPVRRLPPPADARHALRARRPSASGAARCTARGRDQHAPAVFRAATSGRLILPAFGEFTGGCRIDAAAGPALLRRRRRIRLADARVTPRGRQRTGSGSFVKRAARHPRAHAESMHGQRSARPARRHRHRARRRRAAHQGRRQEDRRRAGRRPGAECAAGHRRRRRARAARWSGRWPRARSSTRPILVPAALVDQRVRAVGGHAAADDRRRLPVLRGLREARAQVPAQQGRGRGPPRGAARRL